MFEEASVSREGNKKPEFVSKPDLKPELLEEESGREKMIQKSGFSEEDCQKLISVGNTAFAEHFPITKSGYIDGSATIFTVDDISKVSENKAIIIGEGQRASGANLGRWKMEAEKEEGGAWQIKKALEIQVSI